VYTKKVQGRCFRKHQLKTKQAQNVRGLGGGRTSFKSKSGHEEVCATNFKRAAEPERRKLGRYRQKGGKRE